MSRLFEGKAVIVTGAGRGIGRALALEFAGLGASVIVNNRSPEPAQAVADEIVAAGGTAVAYSGDVSDFAVAAGMIDAAVTRFGRLDALVNNAGALHDRMLVNMSEEDWDASIRVNLRGTFAPLQAAARHWRDRSKAGEAVSAAIVNISSEAGLYHNVGQSNYAAAKAAVLNLTVSASVEFARYGIRVNSVAPVAATRMSEHLIPVANRQAGNFDRYLPERITPAIAWLASEEARAITGRCYDIHGDTIYVAESWRRGPTITTDAPWDSATLRPQMLALHGQAHPNCGLDGLPPKT